MEAAPTRYADMSSFLENAAATPFAAPFRELVVQAENGWGLDDWNDPVVAKVHGQIRKHLDGALLGPAMVALSRGGVLDRLTQGPVTVRSLEEAAGLPEIVFDLLAAQGWIRLREDVAELTAAGRYLVQIAPSYGVTVSYLPNLNNLGTLLFGNVRKLRRLDENGMELLVDRSMNVWGSGGAHTTYFKKVDEIVIEVFNRPLDQQPKGVCDMGCGDATFLEHLYFTIKTRTARGQALDTHPLIVVGADYNKVARRISKQKLRRARVPNCHVIHGDINRPAALAAAFEKLDLDIHDFFHVRSFLDHNRPYLPPPG